LLQFLDGRFGSRVRWVDRHDGVVLVHTLPFDVVFMLVFLNQSSWFRAFHESFLT
jgi:hypothetical protein